MSKEEIRTITIQPEDLELARITKNLEVRLQTTISENDIQKFCKGCDFLSKDNLCKKNGFNNQGRSALRGCCGLASENNIEGYMLVTGFKPFSAPEPNSDNVK